MRQGRPEELMLCGRRKSTRQAGRKAGAPLAARAARPRSACAAARPAAAGTRGRGRPRSRWSRPPGEGAGEKRGRRRAVSATASQRGAFPFDSSSSGSTTAAAKQQPLLTWPSVETATRRLAAEPPSWMASMTSGRISGTSARSCVPATVASSPMVMSTATSKPSSAAGDGGGGGWKVRGAGNVSNSGSSV